MLNKIFSKLGLFVRLVSGSVAHSDRYTGSSLYGVGPHFRGSLGTSACLNLKESLLSFKGTSLIVLARSSL